MPLFSRAHSPQLLPVGAATITLILLFASAPDYLFYQGFPLDDAWIHAVYARELAASATLAYNPGIPATGETSPLWAIMLAPLHALGGSTEAFVALTKLYGFLLLLASAIVLGRALARQDDESGRWTGLAAALVLLHPDLAAASVSGMEVPLAALIVAATVAATIQARTAGVLLAGAAAAWGRPETAVIAAAFPLLFWARERPGLGVRLSLAGSAGAAVAFLALGLRNYNVSGMLLPATFHAKVSAASGVDLQVHLAGFSGLLGQIPLLNVPLLLASTTVLAVVLLARASTSGLGRAGAAMHLAGTIFCGVSFALVPPSDTVAFYHQRYVLPGAFLMVAALPPLAREVLRRLPSRAFAMATAGGLAVIICVALAAAPSRYRRASNDARNVDDVQVALGRALASASPADTAWVVDAGASRYFGGAFVVDLIGLNTPQILGSHAQAYLDAHPPRYLDVFPSWSRIESHASVPMPSRTFETSTPYTVTRYWAMRQHILVSCAPAAARGRIEVRGRTFRFRCAG